MSISKFEERQVNGELGATGFDLLNGDAAGYGSDNVDLPEVGVGIRVGTTAGDVKVTTYKDTDYTIKNVQIGETVPIAVKRVWTTGTTAVGIMVYV